MDWNALKIFLAISKSGTLTGAANYFVNRRYSKARH